MYAIQGDKKLGMDKQENDKNVEIEMEIWCFRTASEYADFIANCVASPLCIGDVYSVFIIIDLPALPVPHSAISGYSALNNLVSCFYRL